MHIDWRDDLLTGVDEIDRQHKELFSRFNLLLDACNQGKGREEVDRMLQFLADYVQTHFRAEEEIQLASGYPELLTHREAHRGFVRQLDGLLEEFRSEGASLPLVIKTNQTLVFWLIDHITKMDKELAVFLQKRRHQP
jgi:hemerythrin